MGKTKHSTLQRSLLVGVAFVCLTLLFGSVGLTKAHATTPLRITYQFGNGSPSLVDTSTPSGGELKLPTKNPTNSDKLFLGWLLKNQTRSKFFTWDWNSNSKMTKKSIRNLPADYASTGYTVDQDATVTAQWATPNSAGLNSLYQFMLSDESPMSGHWGDYGPTKVFKRTLEAGKTYHIQLWIPGGDAFLYVCDSDLEFVEESDDDGYDWNSSSLNDDYLNDCSSYVELTPAKTQTYYFLASTYDEDLYEAGSSFFRIGTDKIKEPKVSLDWVSFSKVIKCTQTVPGAKFKTFKPSKKGYTFVGWFSNAKLTKPVNFNNFYMPIHNTSIFAKWTSNESHLKRVSASNGTYIHKVSKTRYVNHLRISKKKSTVTLRPVRVSAKSTVYMKYKGGTYKKVSSLKVHLKKGQTKTVYIKCVSQTGSKYKSTYRIDVKRNK